MKSIDCDKGRVYKFVRQHKTLRVAPAMAAGSSDKLWNTEDVVALIDAQAEPAKKRGSLQVLRGEGGVNVKAEK